MLAAPMAAPIATGSRQSPSVAIDRCHCKAFPARYAKRTRRCVAQTSSQAAASPQTLFALFPGACMTTSPRIDCNWTGKLHASLHDGECVVKLGPTMSNFSLAHSVHSRKLPSSIEYFMASVPLDHLPANFNFALSLDSI